MGEFDFTYSLPENFNKRVLQYLKQFGANHLAEAFDQCKYEFEDLGLAYYAGMTGAVWDKHAIEFTFEGEKYNLSILESAKPILEKAVGKALRSNESGLLVKNLFFLEDDTLDEIIELPKDNEERLKLDIEVAKSVAADLIQIGGASLLKPFI